MKTFVIGDIHGAARALQQVLDRSPFNPEVDRLITLGDIADGWSEVPECVDILLNIPNRVDIRGNHDTWCWNWMELGQTPIIWTQQGGQATIDAYVRSLKMVDKDHRLFWDNQVDYFIDEDNRLFIHGGYSQFDGSFKEQVRRQPANFPNYVPCQWDRELWSTALSISKIQGANYKKGSAWFEIDGWKEIFIGHTSTVNWKTDEPMNAINVWNLDTGAGWYGKLTIMDAESKEFWQSDLVKELYPDEKGR